VIDLAGLLADAPGPDGEARRRVAERAARVIRPRGALARLDQVAAWLAGWQRTVTPRVSSPVLLVFCADHGVVEEGVTPYPQAVTAQVLRALRAGVATVNRMAQVVGVRVEVVDVGVGRPTANLAREPALSEERFAEAFAAGRKAAGQVKADLLLVGEMGIGNTTAASAVVAALFGGPATAWVGPGSGLDPDGLARKSAVVERAVGRLGSESNPVEVLRQVGGAELAAICGAVTEARLRSMPVLLDGFITAAAVAPLPQGAPAALDHCLAAHRSGEPGHGRLLEALGLPPLLTLDLSLGEGSGAVAALPLVRLACAAVTEVPTFEEWGMPDPS
jgi:nicotinate-nucleotide--dimethylbenzimidazole phosphoribosyltransferase